MLNSQEIEKELKLRGFKLDIDNTHARGYLEDETLIYVKVNHNQKVDPPLPVYKQPLVIHWSNKNEGTIEKLRKLDAHLNLLFQNHNMRGFKGPAESDKPNGIAINIESVVDLDQVLRLIVSSSEERVSVYDEITKKLESHPTLPETIKKE